MTQVVRSGDYEAPALDWMFAQVERLRDALGASGVVDESVQRSICETFFFGLAVEFDDGEVLEEPRSRRRLAFEEADRLLLPNDDTFDFHDYALGIVGEAFGDT